MKPSRLAHIVSEVLCKSVGVDCFLSGLHKGNVSQMFVTGRISDSFCHLTTQLSIRKCVGPAVDHLIAEVQALPFFFTRALLAEGEKKPHSSTCVSASVDEAGKLHPDSFFVRP